MGVAASENFGDVISPGFRKIFYDRLKPKEDIIDKLFSVIGSEKSYVKDSGIGAIPVPTDFSGTINYDDFKQLYDITVNFPEIAQGIQIRRKLYDDDEYRIMNKYPSRLSKRMVDAQQLDATSLFSEAFTYAPADFDAVELCGADHPYNSNNSNSTQSNEGTTELTPAGLTSTRISMMKFTDDQGVRVGVLPDHCVFAIDLEDTFLEITKSKLKAIELSNTANVNTTSRWTYTVLPHEVDSNNWFMMDLSMAKEGEDAMLMWVNRINAEFGKDMSSDNFNAKFYSYARWNKYWNGWEFIFGNLVT